MATMSLAEAFGHETDDEEGVEAGEGLSQLCEDYLQLEAQVEAINERLKAAKEQRDKAEAMILEKMNELGCKSVNTTLGYRFTHVEKSCYGLPPQKEPDLRDQAIKWLKRVGAKPLFKETISDSTLGAFLREREEQGRPIVELFNKFVKVSLSVVKTKRTGKKS
jgi:hypothetical protein